MTAVVDAPVTAEPVREQLPAAPDPFRNGYAGGFGNTRFVDGLDRDEDVPTLAECQRDEAGR
jgi:hypothetical protein